MSYKSSYERAYRHGWRTIGCQSINGMRHTMLYTPYTLCLVAINHQTGAVGIFRIDG